MVKKLAEGDKIEFKEILLASEEKNGKKASSYLSQILEFDNKDDDIIIVSMPVSKGRLIPLPPDTQFDTFFYTGRGLYQCKTHIIGKYKMDNIYVLKIYMDSKLQKYQRRQYYRLEKTFPIIYSDISEEEYIEILEKKRLPEGLMHAERYCEGTALDISGGGMRFVGRNFIPGGQKLLIMFDILSASGNIKYRLPATVVRSFETINTGGKYEHRVEFENISKEYREILIKFIFDEELKMRKGSK